jgi:hypothetical protein
LGAGALPAGAAEADSAGAPDAAAFSGAAGCDEPPPQATMAPIAAKVAKMATIAMFFMMVFLLRVSSI